jgi:hypothetical protein
MDSSHFNLWDCIWAVVSQWAALATGGFVMGLIALIERIREKPINKKLMLTVFVFFLLVAFYRAWEEQYEKANGRRNLRLIIMGKWQQ